MLPHYLKKKNVITIVRLLLVIMNTRFLIPVALINGLYFFFANSKIGMGSELFMSFHKIINLKLYRLWGGNFKILHRLGKIVDPGLLKPETERKPNLKLNPWVEGKVRVGVDQLIFPPFSPYSQRGNTKRFQGLNPMLPEPLLSLMPPTPAPSSTPKASERELHPIHKLMNSGFKLRNWRKEFRNSNQENTADVMLKLG